MSFTTITFLMFLALVFGLYWAARARGIQNLILILASYAFYAWWDWRFCGLMLASTLVDYAAGLGLGLGLGHGRGGSGRRWILLASVAFNLGLLGFFKYFNFFTAEFQALAGSLGWTVHPITLHVVLPVGISFYTFQTMSYTLDVYRGHLPPTKRLVEYMAYVSFFPQLVAGPIERASQLLPQFLRPRVFDYDRAVDGCRQMLWGFFKKMVIADNLAPLVDRAYANPDSFGGAELFMATLLFAWQIYCDFSAYSDLAIGAAKLFGFELQRNFALPYFSRSLSEFWRRWHISLATWFRDYVYVPLRGRHCPRSRQALNILVVFVLSGIWHGAAWTFLVWGLLHGLALLIEKSLSGCLPSASAGDLRESRPGSNLVTVCRVLLTFAVVCLGWVWFRAHSLDDAFGICAKIVPSLTRAETPFLMAAYAGEGPLGSMTLPLLAGFVALEWGQRRRAHPLAGLTWSRPWRWLLYLGTAAVIVLWGTLTHQPFIYFQF